MNKESLLIKELAEVTGTELELDASGMCELVADDNLIVLRYREASEDWLCFGVVLEGGDGTVPRATLAKALELSLFGAGTVGLSLGLHGNALVLSDCVSSVDLTAEAFADRILFLSRRISSISELLNETVESGRDLEMDSVRTALDECLIPV